MDLNYILQNTIIYGSIAFVLTNIFNNNEYLNFATWMFLVLISYIIHHILTLWFDFWIFITFIWSIIVFYLLDYSIYKFFKSSKKRELFGLIFTLGFSIFAWNFLFFIYWPNTISLNTWKISELWLFIILFLLIVSVYYLYKLSFFWKTLKAIRENDSIINSLWVRTWLIKTWTIIISFLLLFISSYIILSTSSINPDDNTFFLIKWIWIMIIVWVNKIEYLFVWSFLYVLLEHILFINIWLPVWYKESLVLIIILLILIFKPTWLFNLKFRNI